MTESDEQRILDAVYLRQATEIIEDALGKEPFMVEQSTLEIKARQLAINWCVTAMQETANADYWKERAEAAERLNGASTTLEWLLKIFPADAVESFAKLSTLSEDPNREEIIRTLETATDVTPTELKLLAHIRASWSKH